MSIVIPSLEHTLRQPSVERKLFKMVPAQSICAGQGAQGAPWESLGHLRLVVFGEDWNDGMTSIRSGS